MQAVNNFLTRYHDNFNNDGKQMIANFFVTFSRFEFALKDSIVFANRGWNNKVEPNWDRFLRTIQENFNLRYSDDLFQASEYLLRNPPRIQLLLDNQIEWHERSFPPHVTELHRIGQHIRDMRNNLFHGGKFDDNFDPSSSRNYRLLNAGLVLLNEFLRLEPRVARYFNEV